MVRLWFNWSLQAFGGHPVGPAHLDNPFSNHFPNHVGLVTCNVYVPIDERYVFVLEQEEFGSYSAWMNVRFIGVVSSQYLVVDELHLAWR